MAKLNLRNKGKDYKTRIVQSRNTTFKFSLSKPTYLNNTSTSLSKRHNFLFADQPPIVIIDTTPPSIPQNLIVNYISLEIHASCDPSTDANSSVRGYRWYCNGAFIEETIGTNYIFTNTPIGDIYNIQVSAIDTKGNESDLSIIQSIDASYPLDPILNIIIGDEELTAVVDPTYLTTYFYNWYLDDVLIDTTDTINPGAESYVFPGLINLQEYKIGVKAIKQYGIESNITSEYGTPIYISVPDPPTNLEGIATEDGNDKLEIELDWDPAYLAESYDIFLQESLGNFVKVNTSPILITNYTIYGLDIELEYNIYVVSKRSTLSSSPSNVVNIIYFIGEMILEDYMDSRLTSPRATYADIPFDRPIPPSAKDMPEARPSWDIIGKTPDILGTSPNKSFVIYASGLERTNVSTVCSIDRGTFEVGMGIWTANQNYVNFNFLTQGQEVDSLTLIPKNGYSVVGTRRTGSAGLRLVRYVNGVEDKVLDTYSTTGIGAFRFKLVIDDSGLMTVTLDSTVVLQATDLYYTTGTHVGFTLQVANNTQVYTLMGY